MVLTMMIEGPSPLATEHKITRGLMDFRISGTYPVKVNGIEWEDL